MTSIVRFSGREMTIDGDTDGARRSIINNIASDSLINNPTLHIQCSQCTHVIEYTFNQSDVARPVFPTQTEMCPDEECTGYMIEWEIQ